MKLYHIYLKHHITNTKYQTVEQPTVQSIKGTVVVLSPVSSCV